MLDRHSLLWGDLSAATSPPKQTFVASPPQLFLSFYTFFFTLVYPCITFYTPVFNSGRSQKSMEVIFCCSFTWTKWSKAKLHWMDDVDMYYISTAAFNIGFKQIWIVLYQNRYSFIKSALQNNVEIHLISCLGSFATLKSEIFGLRSKARASAGAVQLFRELPGTFNFPEHSAKWGHYIFPFVLIMGEPVCTVDVGGTNAVSDGSFCHSQIAFEALYLFVSASHQVFPS